MTEGLIIRLIHNTDLLSMLQLSVREVLRLRLLSQKINIIILNAKNAGLVATEKAASR